MEFLHRKAKRILVICCFLRCFFLPLKIARSSSANFFMLLPGKLKKANLELSLLISRQARLQAGLYFAVQKSEDAGRVSLLVEGQHKLAEYSLSMSYLRENVC